MKYAVVKFIAEQNGENEVVQEIPVSWLTKNNTYCKWPPEKKYAGIYISKAVPPGPAWTEFPITVECFCNSLPEAREKVKSGIAVPTKEAGRGHRALKATDYFSPAEEEERGMELKRELAVKKTSLSGMGNAPFTEYLENVNTTNSDYVKIINELNADELKTGELNMDEQNTDGATVYTYLLYNNENENNENNVEVVNTEDHNTDIINNSASGVDSGSEEEVNSSEKSGRKISLVNEIRELNKNMEAFETIMYKKMDKLIDILANLDLRMTGMESQLKEIQQGSKLNKEEGCIKNAIPFNFPLKSLEELEAFEQYLNNSSNKVSFVQYIKSIGGNDAKEFYLRICKAVFSNQLGELCSWLGRKNNFAIGNLVLVNIIFDVVSRKFCQSSKKEMEFIVAEWLRHAKQRRIREDQRLN